MRSRRIKIEGDRYLIFYTFEDEPWLGPAASGDASERSNEQQGDARTPSAEQRRDAGRGEQSSAVTGPRAEGRDV